MAIIRHDNRRHAHAHAPRTLHLEQLALHAAVIALALSVVLVTVSS